MKVALDAIIKFNCEVNEFNYMNDFAYKLKSKVTPLVLHQKNADWAKLFEYYDKERNNELSKVEVKQMMIDCGFTECTDAEVQFVLNKMTNFRSTISVHQFKDWCTKMIRYSQKELIYYSEYLDVSTMKMRTEREVALKRLAQGNFLQRFESEQKSTYERVPDSIKVLCSEMFDLGESMIRKCIRRYAVNDPQTKTDLIEFE